VAIGSLERVAADPTLTYMSEDPGSRRGQLGKGKTHMHRSQRILLARPVPSPRAALRHLVPAVLLTAALSVARVVQAEEASGQGSVSPGTPASQIPGRLTLERALELGRTHGYEVALAEAAVADARANRVVARTLANPTLSGWIGKSFNPYGGPCIGCKSLAWGVGISDEGTISDVLFGKRHLRDAAATSGIDASQRLREDALRNLTAAVEQQYLAAAVADRTRSLTLTIAERVGRVADLVQLRYRAGDVSEADVLRAETELLQIKQQIEQQVADLAAAKARLAAWLGVRGETPSFEVDTSVLDQTPPTALATANREALLRAALSQRPDYRALEFQLRQAERSLDVERRNRVPPVALSVSYAQQGWGQNAISPPTLTFGASLPLPVLNQNQGGISKAEAAMQTARLTRAQLEAQISADIAAARAHLTAAQTRLERMTELLEHTRKALDLIQLRYEKGAASLIDLLDAQRSYVSANQDRIALLGETWGAIYEMKHALGGALPR
jgi:outer membrane protein, heavy metal efflux system